MTCEQVCTEFTLKKLSFEHDIPEDFVASSWDWLGRKTFTAYRLFWTIIITAYMIFDIVWESITIYPEMPAYWLLYGINWVFLLFVITHLLLGILTAKYCCCGKIPTDAQRRSTFVFYTLSSNLVCMASFIFWMGLHEIEQPIFTSPSAWSKHISLPILVVMDIIFSSVPVRLCQVIYPITGGLLYALFNMTYSLLHGPTPKPSDHAIYPVLDWKTVTGAVVMAVLILFIGILVQTLLYAVFLMREFIKDLAGSSRAMYASHEDSQTQSILTHNSQVDLRSIPDPDIRSHPDPNEHEMNSLPQNGAKNYNSINKQ